MSKCISVSIPYNKHGAYEEWVNAIKQIKPLTPNEVRDVVGRLNRLFGITKKQVRKDLGV
ncbi:hypothetical protein [Vibrio mytili]|uniref:Uncharacterized protein n=1 Tax=Vibrio mytili TaxID=50718 RepID=A0A0C3IB69_9VIBR|nr:hypothetical protein [Vibrio mytili]KIN12235.1 hypothetical protein SU60_02845 [Vibrio mytili]